MSTQNIQIDIALADEDYFRFREQTTIDLSEKVIVPKPEHPSGGKTNSPDASGIFPHQSCPVFAVFVDYHHPKKICNKFNTHTIQTHGKMMNSDGGDEDAYSIKRDDIMRIEDAIVVVVVVEDSDAAVIDAMTMLQH